MNDKIEYIEGTIPDQDPPGKAIIRFNDDARFALTDEDTAMGLVNEGKAKFVNL